MERLLTIAHTALARRLRRRNAALDLVLWRELARQGVLFRAGVVDLGLARDRVNAARRIGGNRGGNDRRGGRTGGSGDGSGGPVIGDGNRWRTTTAIDGPAAGLTWCALVVVESPDCVLGRRWEGRLVTVRVEETAREGGGGGPTVFVRTSVLRSTCLCELRPSSWGLLDGPGGQSGFRSYYMVGSPWMEEGGVVAYMLARRRPDGSEHSVVVRRVLGSAS